MKTKLFSILAASALAFASCSDDNPVVPPVKGEKDLVGEIKTNTTLDANTEYTLTGALYVESGATLEIPAGTVIKAKNGGTGIFVLVKPGGKLIANGTADKPVVFTSNSSSPKEGDWGGIIINGKAPLSGPSGVVTQNTTEMDSNVKYGGDQPNDNSGVLNYVKIEYTGARMDSNKEHNGLTLNGVGNGTKISNIYLRYGADDAIEFFGGTVDASNIFVENCSDDMFDFTEGYRGTITNAYGIREKGFSDATADPRGIEADGNFDGNGPTHANQSDFKVNGITIVNNAADIVGQDGKVSLVMNKEVFKIRRNAKATITNAYVKFGAGTTPYVLIDTDGANAETSIQYNFDPANGLDKAKIVNPVNATLTKNNESKGADVSAFTWTGYKFQ